MPGTEYVISDMVCIFCGKRPIFEVGIMEYFDYKNPNALKTPEQALPSLTAEQVKELVTGNHAACWASRATA